MYTDDLTMMEYQNIVIAEGFNDFLKNELDV
jgi:hypothetical protein